MSKDFLTGKKYGRKAVIVFFTMVILFSGVCETLYCMGGSEWLVAILMWIPAISAIVASLVSIAESGERYSFKNHRSLIGIRFSHIKYILMGVFIPFVYLFIPYRVYWTMHPENYAYNGVAFSLILKDLALYTVISVLVSLLTALGEEIGWRGFMLPALLERIGVIKAFAIVGLFWCLWHFPLLIWGGYMEGASLLYSLIAFLLCIFPVSIIAAILTIKSQSVWPAAFLHAAHNAYDQAVFAGLTGGNDKMYYVSETGCITIICAWAIAIIMLCLYKPWKDEKC
ncbi:CPBP family intramembrane glutamic endopeptidase [Pseudobutyrivibrio xylanivorans]|uniref:CAAX protease self-immunity n=1 Tax=Pseudobutyrivibrio xylanivorans TaxID=185007 RepID=A0A1G5RZK9_PSEXY|nr:CPBP family intramembrane glutamic endopeptidase [Pseudobutyrivibrio xylanivorans]SCZ79532.1 CAAX protease self-immunity [Pseudobutyrivibrio xylanivorans]